ncbi:hypothetical protein LINPERHAP2_LOCUS19042 [Linum perenne]
MWMGMDLQQLGNRRDYGCVSSSSDQAKEDFDFNDDDICGLVFGDDQVVKIGLTNIKDVNVKPYMSICSVEPPRDYEFDVWKHFSYQRRFAVVQGKLFAIGGAGVHLLDEEDVEIIGGDGVFVDERNMMYPLGIHFCDLQKVFSSESESGQFELAVHLKGPKISPIVVPYKKKKEIFLISNPCFSFHDFPFEVLSFSNEEFGVKQLSNPPFWVQGKFARVEAHAVAENRL